MGPMDGVRRSKDKEVVQRGNVPYDQVYGPNGWCVAERSARCDNCMIDGLWGPYCEEVTEMYCPNQCSGHGECYLGFCQCHASWYGLDCSRQAAGSPPAELPDSLSGVKKYLMDTGLGKPPPATSAGIMPHSGAVGLKVTVTRKKPFIFVYDTPPDFTTRMLQYRVVWKACIWRRFHSGNESKLNDWIYGVETYFHDMMLASEHRCPQPGGDLPGVHDLVVTCQVSTTWW
eukprot:gene9448-1685_t